MHLLILILDDLERLPDLLASWKKIGVRATLVESQGGFRVSNWMDRMGLRALNGLLSGRPVHDQRLLLSVVENDDLLEKAITEAERVLEGFDRPGSGILFSLPVGRTLGLGKSHFPDSEIQKGEDAGAARLGIDPTTPVSKIADILNLKPCMVRRSDAIEDVVAKMLTHPSVNVVAVVSEEERLVGLIDMPTLSEALFFQIFPESFFADLHNIEDVKAFVKKPHKVQKAGDIMTEAAFIREDDSLMKAFQVLQGRKLEGLPVVDEHNRPVGYIHLLELMEVCLHPSALIPSSEPSDEL